MMKTGNQTMTELTFERAVEIMKSFSSTGNLLDGLEYVDEIMRDIAAERAWNDDLSPLEKAAFRLVVRKMRPLFV
jgi:hypothetical protein